MPCFPIAILAVLAVLRSASCSVLGGVGDEVDPPSAPRVDEATSADDPVALAVRDLAAYTGLDPADIQVVAYDQVTWRNGSLGCLQPGRVFMQMLVDGYRIVLRSGADEHAYHGARGQAPFRCPQPDPNGAVDRIS